MIFESHAHFEDPAFDEDREELLTQVHSGLIETIVDVGSTLESSRQALELARTHDYIYAAVGIHPEEIGDFDGREDAVMQEIREAAADPKTVSIGEIGLDYYWVKDEDERKKQRFFFKEQLSLARELDLPVIVHSRDAAEDTMDIMREACGLGTRAVIHAYSYSLEQAREYIDMGCYIGVGGVVTFKNGRKLRGVVEEIPLERILTETDCPYMTPEPFRGMRNDSGYLPYVVKRIADIKGLTEYRVMETTRENGYTFYGITPPHR